MVDEGEPTVTSVFQMRLQLEKTVEIVSALEMLSDTDDENTINTDEPYALTGHLIRYTSLVPGWIPCCLNVSWH